MEQSRPMSKPNIEDIYQLSPGQHGMLTVVLLAGSGSDLYFDQSTLTLGGGLDEAAWDRAGGGTPQHPPGPGRGGGGCPPLRPGPPSSSGKGGASRSRWSAGRWSSPGR